MRRVAITGMGVVSPIGNDMKTFRKNLLEGVCGIDYITRFDPEEYKVKIAAEVKDFRITDHVDKSEARRMDLFTQYAVVAAKEAISQSGILGTVEPEKFGVYIGSGIGGMDTLVNTMDRFRAGDREKFSSVHSHDDFQYGIGQHCHSIQCHGTVPSGGDSLRHIVPCHWRGLSCYTFRIRRCNHRRRNRSSH